jgi:segregation and condensation protein B
VRLQRGPDGAQLVTAPESAAHVEYFLGMEAARRLSTAALETLAIVAYRQPVTRGTIETIRGVSSDAAVATLRARGLIAEGGRAEGPGRPVLWVTTQRFLHHFGLERPSDLPPLPADIELPAEDAGAQLELGVTDGGSPPPADESPGDVEAADAERTPAP